MVCHECQHFLPDVPVRITLLLEEFLQIALRQTMFRNLSRLYPLQLRRQDLFPGLGWLDEFGMQHLQVALGLLGYILLRGELAWAAPCQPQTQYHGSLCPQSQVRVSHLVLGYMILSLRPTRCNPSQHPFERESGQEGPTQEEDTAGQTRRAN